MTHVEAMEAACAPTPSLPAAAVARLAHEIRGGLQVILGHAQLLTHGAGDASTTTSSSQAIHRAGLHVLALLDDVGALAAIDAGTGMLTVEPVDVHHAALEALELARGMRAPSGVRLELGSGEPMTVAASPLHLRQVLLNLLSNALKYNRMHGLVRVGWRSCGHYVAIDVDDTGSGIPRSAAETVFLPFVRLDTTSTVPGHGIGLAVARSLTEAMGGHIEMHSVEGAGSTFSVLLPRG